MKKKSVICKSSDCLKSLTAIYSAILIFGCSKPNSASESESINKFITLSSVPKHIGVFGFDGTNSTIESNNSILRFVNEAQSESKKYFAGTDLIAANYLSQQEAAIKAICQINEKKPFDAVALIGYSRGAGMALSVATRLETSCSSRVKVRWLGLIDTNVVFVEESLRQGNTKRSMTETRCVHATKTNGLGDVIKDFVLQTSAVLWCDAKSFENTDHLSIATSAETFAWLKNDAQSVLPALFPMENNVPMAPQDKMASCQKHSSSVYQCLQAKCIWSGNARCEASQE